MRCEDVAERLSLKPAEQQADAALRAHLEGCAACRALAAKGAALDRVLALDVPHTPGPGFDTRMLARLHDERAAFARKKQPLWQRLRWTLAVLPAAAALAFVLLRRDAGAPLEAPLPPAELAAALDPEELELAMDLELALELDVATQLEELEDYELLADIDEAELQQLAEQDAPGEHAP